MQERARSYASERFCSGAGVTVGLAQDGAIGNRRPQLFTPIESICRLERVEHYYSGICEYGCMKI